MDTLPFEVIHQIGLLRFPVKHPTYHAVHWSHLLTHCL
jgi:hypothetical protein